MRNLSLIVALLVVLLCCKQQSDKRTEISLNGLWTISKTNLVDGIPSAFFSEIPVPGLVDMASPEIDNQETAYTNSVYWYKTTFKMDDRLDAEFIQLKINKAMYHTRVYLNRKLVGDNVYNFTPSFFDVKPFLNKQGKENELIIAVGCNNNLPDTVTHGRDFEKTRYIPGIYDDVKLIVSGYPYIKNVQVVPDIQNEQLRIIAEILTNSEMIKTPVSYQIREAVSGEIKAEGKTFASTMGNKENKLVDFTAQLKNCRLWSPESPFLYKLELTTSADNITIPFGMRRFEASRDSGVFLLNGKPYFLRGTNVCILRFFEDPDRENLPWNSEWITRLHQRFKEMHWNSIRYCIGFPPERWYEIADSLGFLIQDEYPIWTSVKRKGGFDKLLPGVTSERLGAEYLQWMRERWNHPCVVIWDAQNESVTGITGEAINLVRQYDLSNRPWDNGWAIPVSERDAIEAHIYLFGLLKHPSEKKGYLKKLFGEVRVPQCFSPSPDGIPYRNPVILNEYGWAWLNRDGTPTTLTDRIYSTFFPEADTPDKRFEVYAKNLSIKTEYWRAHRKVAAVMHFCGLGYSRSGEPRGQTSDNFIDIQNLIYEPHFYKYMKSAFSPICIMADFWEQTVSQGQRLDVPVHLINDTYEMIEDSLRFTMFRDNDAVVKKSVPFVLDGLQKKILKIEVMVPAEKGIYHLEYGIVYKGDTIKSTREFETE